MLESKTPGKTLVPQPHGGALLKGGLPGNKGGGRKPSEALRILLDVNIKSAKKLEQMVDSGKELSPGELTTILDKSGRYVHVQKSIVVTVKARKMAEDISMATARFFKDIGSPEVYDLWLDAVKECVTDNMAQVDEPEEV